MNDPIFEKVRDFVSNHLRIKKQRLTRTTRLLDDLGCTGDDAYELMEDFFMEFSIDPRNFVFLKYFEWEGGVDLIGITHLIMKLKGVKMPPDQRYLTLGDLVDSVTNGRWDENCGELRKHYSTQNLDSDLS